LGLRWADFTTLPLRNERRATPKFFAAGRQIAAKTSAFATASEQKSARKRLLLAKIERESVRKRKFLRGFLKGVWACSKRSMSVH